MLIVIKFITIVDCDQIHLKLMFCTCFELVSSGHEVEPFIFEIWLIWDSNRADLWIEQTFGGSTLSSLHWDSVWNRIYSGPFLLKFCSLKFSKLNPGVKFMARDEFNLWTIWKFLINHSWNRFVRPWGMHPRSGDEEN